MEIHETRIQNKEIRLKIGVILIDDERESFEMIWFCLEENN